MGHTTQEKEHVHISDGGHFDNLGVYELIKRRCRYIVAVDATDDPATTSDNLGILVRLCRVDFGVRIQLDTTPLKVEGPDGYSRAHVVVGRIRYDDLDNRQTPGMLIYIKSTMTGDEPADVRQYAKLHPEFPRQLTLTDQSFDEDQFPKLPRLGTHTAINVFGIASQSLFDGLPDRKWWENQERKDFAKVFAEAHRKIFSALRNRWTEPPLIRDGDRLESSRTWIQLQETLRQDPDLTDLDRDLYSDLPALADPTRRAELHVMEEALRMMADTWAGLNQGGHDDTLISASYLNMFRRLTGSETFRRFWPLLRSQFNRDFVRFCERQLRVRVAPPRLSPAANHPEYLKIMGHELAREWPNVVCRDDGRGESLAEAGERYVRLRVEDAVTIGTRARPERAAWVVVQAPLEYEPSKEPGFEIPVGLVVLRRVPKRKRRRMKVNYELIFWMSRAQRSSGIGERVRLGGDFKRLIQWLAKCKATVMVSYPKDERRRRRGSQPSATVQLLLARRLQAAHESAAQSGPGMDADQEISLTFGLSHVSWSGGAYDKAIR